MFGSLGIQGFGREEVDEFGVQGFRSKGFRAKSVGRTLLLNLGHERATRAPPQWRDPGTQDPSLLGSDWAGGGTEKDEEAGETAAGR